MEHACQGRPTARPQIDPEPTPPDKAAVRRRLRDARARKDADERRREDDARTARLVAWLAHRGPLRRVACYESRGTEPDTARVIGWLRAQGVAVLVPYGWQGAGNGTAPPRWAVLDEPPVPPGDPMASGEALANLDAILVPGLAGTRRGDRLGRGAGWYDRALRQRPGRAPTVLLLWHDEVLATLPVEPHDVPVDYLATPDGVIATGATPFPG